MQLGHLLPRASNSNLGCGLSPFAVAAVAWGNYTLFRMKYRGLCVTVDWQESTPWQSIMATGFSHVLTWL